MSDESERRPDRARAFVPALIPAPEEVDASGPLTPKELKLLSRIHEARDHYGQAKWMRGKALAAAFSRHLYRGEDGARTRQEYLDAEWDGISETAAYREIAEWPLAEQIAQAYGRPVADSHVRALVEVSEERGVELVAGAYVELRHHGAAIKQRVTAEVVENLAAFLAAGRTLPAGEPTGEPQSAQGTLEGLFTAREIPGPRKGPKGSKGPKGRAKTRRTVTPTRVIPRSETGDGWQPTGEQIQRLSTWITAEAERTGTPPDDLFETVLEVLASTPENKV